MMAYFSCDRFAVIKQVQSFFPAIFILDVAHFAFILVIKNNVNVGILTEIETKETLKQAIALIFVALDVNLRILTYHFVLGCVKIMENWADDGVQNSAPFLLRLRMSVQLLPI